MLHIIYLLILALLFKLNPYILSILVGYLLFEICSAPATGLKNRVDEIFGINASIKIPIGEHKYLHLHHWIILSTILALTLIHDSNNKFLIGFCIGGIIQGFRYDDWNKIVVDGKKMMNN